jgi:hypothetical protein
LNAGTRYDKRKNCIRGLSWRYKTEVAINGRTYNRSNGCTATSDRAKDAGCSIAEATAYGIGYKPFFDCVRGNIRGKNSSMGEQTTITNGQFFDTEYDKRSIVRKYNQYYKTNSYEGGISADVLSNINFTDTLTDNNNISFKGMSGFMLLPNNDEFMRYTYEVIIWEANSDDDEEITSNKILYMSNFEFTYNNGYQYSGNLFKNGYSIIDTDSGKVLVLNNTLDTTLSFDSSKKIVITVRFHTDEITNGQQSSLIVDKNPENSINSYLKNIVGFNKLNIYSVSEDNIKVDYEVNSLINYSEKITLENISIDGKVTGKTIKLKINSKEDQTFLISKKDLNLKNGINIIKIQYGKEIFTYRYFLTSEY